ncbi:MAG: NAD(P)H-hydrate epimerase, partial [Anaerolineales bacterium]|nr:hypothetical protein [Anaerolineales bacterium]MDW8447795.1 NAD(P)H-hydrate epimerase [Anaerolineales bacterium]
MRKYVTVSEMRAIEQEADQLGLTYAQMMENAGVSLGQIVAQEFGSQTNRTVVGLVGSGNNGGDTLVALAYLAKLGWKVVAYLVKERPADDPLVGRVLDRGGMVICVEKDDAEYRQLQAAIGQSDVLLDGVLGTGFQLPLKESLAKVLKAAKRCLEAKSSPT